jgi:hypothetical protein
MRTASAAATARDEAADPAETRLRDGGDGLILRAAAGPTRATALRPTGESWKDGAALR